MRRTIGILVLWLGLASVAHANDATPRPRPVLNTDNGEARQIVERAWYGGGRRSSEEWARSAYESLRQQGWLWARLQVSAAGDSVTLETGTRARIRNLQITGADSLQIVAFGDAAGVKEGGAYRPGEWPAQCARGLDKLGESGHPFASVTILDMQEDRDSGQVDLSLFLNTGAPARIGKVEIVGATHTKPEVLARLAGIPDGAEYKESLLERARERLEAREVVDSVTELAPLVASPDGSEVDVRIHVQQSRTTGRFSAAAGFFQDPSTGETRLFGYLDLVLLDLFGSARQLRGSWNDDGVSRRRLDLSYLEPLLLGTPFDLRLALGQRHEDEDYDSILADLGLRIPWRGDESIEMGLGIDRTTFVGQAGRVRTRRKLSAILHGNRQRPPEAGVFGRIRTRIEAAQVQDNANTADGEAARQNQTQTIVEAELNVGWALGSRLAIETRGAWASVTTDVLPIPRSEQFFIGGSRSVRGHRENEFGGEVTAFGGVQLVLGRAHAGQVYAFADFGYARETLDPVGDRREAWIRGYGLGLRSPTPFGRLDLALGFPGPPRFDQGLLHLALIQEF